MKEYVNERNYLRLKILLLIESFTRWNDDENDEMRNLYFNFSKEYFTTNFGFDKPPTDYVVNLT